MSAISSPLFTVSLDDKLARSCRPVSCSEPTKDDLRKMTVAELGNDLHALEQPLGEGFPDALSALADLLANGGEGTAAKKLSIVGVTLSAACTNTIESEPA